MRTFRLAPSLTFMLFTGVTVFACGVEGGSGFQEPDPNLSSSSSSSSGQGITPPDASSSSSGDGGGRPEVGCGNGRLEQGEVCDDANTVDGDGCSADCTVVETGFLCSQEGAACVPLCGDGLLRGDEACDDGNTKNNDGCSTVCQFEPGFHCPTPGQPCVAAVCGNGVREGLELCDDGNDAPYDGCYDCKFEPSCNGNGCTGVCGDGLVFPNEECDDGNNRSGDGCSSTCTFEPGFECKNLTDELPDSLILPVIYRDFKSPYTAKSVGQSLEEDTDEPEGHPDFERYWTAAAAGGATIELVKNRLGEDGRPVFNRGADPACEPGTYSQLAGCQQLQGEAEFDEWYHDPAVAASGRSRRVLKTMELKRVPGTDTYQFDGAAPPYKPFQFFPIDGEGWGTQDDDVCRSGVYGGEGVVSTMPMQCVGATYTLNAEGKCLFANRTWWDGDWREAGTPITDNPATPEDETSPFPTNWNCIGDDATPHNFHFTTELHYWFTYQDPGNDTDGPELSFAGDDDVWIFINGRRVIDLGGLHGVLTANFKLTRAKAAELELVENGVYDIALFHAERHSTASNFKYTLGGFLKTKTTCTPRCGDGIKTRNETCDDGVLAGGYNQCAEGCVWGPRCGDGVVQSQFGEQCDDQNFVDNDGCSSDCKKVDEVH